MTNKKIADYALIGNGHTCALVHKEGSIDWACFPRFDSKAIFAKLLGNNDHGYWSLIPARFKEVTRRYVPDTNILSTQYRCETGVLEVNDFMPVDSKESSIVRLVKVLQGSMEITENLSIKTSYGKIPPRKTFQRERLGRFSWEKFEMFYLSEREFQIKEEGVIERKFEVKEGEEFASVLIILKEKQRPKALEKSRKDLFNVTKKYWEKWAKRIDYKGKHKALVKRSALTLKCMAYARTGAIIAAPTTSLPENIGGERNWDYRYAWIRDSVFIVNAFTKLNHEEEAKGFFNWALKTIEKNDYKIAVGYDVEGKKTNKETNLDHLPGFNNSRPVRIKNSGLAQFQLDVYGEFLLCLHHCWNQNLIEAQVELEPLLSSLLSVLLIKRLEPDQGIWETRSAPRFYTYSQAMAWLGLDRGAKLYKTLGGTSVDFNAIEAAKEDIKIKIFKHGVDRKRQCFVQHFNTCALDAANLRLGIMGFIDPLDEIMINTVNETIKRLYVKGALFRYSNEDGIDEKEGAFITCGFWLVQVLTMQGRTDEAKKIFNFLIGLGNDFGLFSEEVDPDSKELLGNFPQAFSHLGLINAAVGLFKD